jgi:hypothetical protein
LFIYYTLLNQSCSFAKLEHGSEDTSIDDCFLDQRNLEERKRATIREESREISNLYVLFSIYLSPPSIHVTYVSVCLFSQSIVHPRTRVGRCQFTFYFPRRVFPTLPGGEGDCPSWEIIIGVSVIILHVSSLHPCHLIHSSTYSTIVLLRSMPHGGGSLRGRHQIPLSLSARLGNLKWAESSTSRHVTSLHFISLRPCPFTHPSHIPVSSLVSWSVIYFPRPGLSAPWSEYGLGLFADDTSRTRGSDRYLDPTRS